MGLFKALRKAVKTTVDVALVPVAVVQDAVTLGGVLTDKKEPYTESRLKKAYKHAGETYDAIDSEER